MKVNRFAVATVGAVLCGAIALSAQQQQPPRQPPAPGQLAPDYYKDIKVLTKVPADQLRNQMEYFTALLGVQCNFSYPRWQTAVASSTSRTAGGSSSSSIP
jgi:hypothetical protein